MKPITCHAPVLILSNQLPQDPKKYQKKGNIKEMIDTLFEHNNNTVAEELVSSENIVAS